MADEVIVEIPDGMELDGEKIDEEILREALDALKAKKASQAKSRERRENLTDEEKLEIAQAAKVRRADIALKVQYAKDNGYQPTKEAIAAFLAGNE